MTVVDTSAVVDFLLGVGAATQVEQMMASAGTVAAPDVLTFEVLAVMRRMSLRGELSDGRAAGMLADLADLPLELFPSLPLRHDVWTLRRNLTTADALFVALAMRLGEPLATKDTRLASAAVVHAGIDVIPLAD